MTEPPVVFSFYNTLIYAWIAIAVVVFFILLRITAPYGRHTVKGWGPQISNRLGWIIMESPVLIVLYALVLPQRERLPLEVWMMLGLFTFHYIHRAFIFPFRLHTKGKTMPLVIAGSGILFNLVNGFLLGYFFAYLQRYPVLWFADARFILGVLIFFVGLYINWKADDKLIHLRKPGETGYIIPRGWLFEKISCPNLFGELIEWLGFAILCWNLPSLTFFIWTAANLIPRAISHHRWYQEKFPEYPKTRKAILPFVV